MSDSYKDLVIRYNRGSLSSKEELRKRKAFFDDKMNNLVKAVLSDMVAYYYNKGVYEFV